MKTVCSCLLPTDGQLLNLGLYDLIEGNTINYDLLKIISVFHKRKKLKPQRITYVFIVRYHFKSYHTTIVILSNVKTTKTG